MLKGFMVSWFHALHLWTARCWKVSWFHGFMHSISPLDCEINININILIGSFVVSWTPSLDSKMPLGFLISWFSGFIVLVVSWVISPCTPSLDSEMLTGLSFLVYSVTDSSDKLIYAYWWEKDGLFVQKYGHKTGVSQFVVILPPFFMMLCMFRALMTFSAVDWSSAWNHETTKPWNRETCQHLTVQRWCHWNHETMKLGSPSASRCPEMEFTKPWNQAPCQHLAVQKWSAWNHETTKPVNISLSRHGVIETMKLGSLSASHCPKMECMKPWNHKTMKPQNYERNHETEKPVNISLSRDGVIKTMNSWTHEIMKPLNHETMKPRNHETCQHFTVHQWCQWWTETKVLSCHL